ncbi:MAG: peptide chain release factor 1 [Pseudomonadota bacterium]
MLPEDRLNEIIARAEYLEARLAETANAEEIATLSRDYAALRPVVASIEEWRHARTALAEAEALFDDAEMRTLAREEAAEIEARLPEIEQALRLSLLPKDAADDGAAILEVRPGTGGDEAALFAADLMRMYARYADAMGWKLETLEESLDALGGLREGVAAIRGEGVFAKLKFESGVHRVQRVPVTESGGRIHTSAATVAVLPEAGAVDIEIRPEDLRVDTMRASGAGGQHVNTTDSAVRITHLPTGLVVTASEKSQHQNRARALEVLRARLYDIERRRAEAERAADRKGQVGSGDRSERVRTYNFPQGRVTDHRIGLTLYRLEQIMAGGLGEIVGALVAADRAERLAAEGF